MARKPSLSLPASQPPKIRTSAIAPSRVGKRAVVCWLDKAAHEEFLIAARRQGTSAQVAVEEMIATWMRQNGARMP